MWYYCSSSHTRVGLLCDAVYFMYAQVFFWNAFYWCSDYVSDLWLVLDLILMLMLFAIFLIQKMFIVFLFIERRSTCLTVGSIVTFRRLQSCFDWVHLSVFHYPLCVVVFVHEGPMRIWTFATDEQGNLVNFERLQIWRQKKVSNSVRNFKISKNLQTQNKKLQKTDGTINWALLYRFT